MEYIYGTTKIDSEEVENLKTIGDEHTDLKGFNSILREYPDQKITDDFKIVKKYHSTEDAEGKCYDFYVISNHRRICDHSSAVMKDYQSKIDYLAMMTGVDWPDDDKEVQND